MILNEQDNDKNLTSIEFTSELQSSFIEYAKALLVGRVIPRVEDGFKSVQRRILYSMAENLNIYSERFRKSARICGDIGGKYHPHGETSIYEAYVKMAQDFYAYIPLVQGQGNFGSVDGDMPAAQRYTEGRLSKAGTYLLTDVSKNIMNLIPNYDNSLQEPLYLPVRFPVVLVNGNLGIAVGFTTFIPSHNAGEVLPILQFMLLESENYKLVEYKDIKHLLPGPDFPVYCIIDSNNLDNIYTNGSGSLVTTVRMEYDSVQKAIITYGLPLHTKKIKLIQSIAAAIKDGIITGIKDVIDDSKDNKYMLRILLSDSVNPETTMKRLKKYTLCTNVNNIAFRFVVNNRPKLLNFCKVLAYFIDQRFDTIKRRLISEIQDALSRIEKILALFIVSKTDKIFEVIKNILLSSDVNAAREMLYAMDFDVSSISTILPRNFSNINLQKFKLTKIQVEYLLSTTLSRLSRGKLDDLSASMKSYKDKIVSLEEVLHSDIKIKHVIVEEAEQFCKISKTSRICDLKALDNKIYTKDLEVERDIFLFLTSNNKLLIRDSIFFKSQKRGGKGRNIKSDDNSSIIGIIQTTTHKDILLFSTFGVAYKLNVFDIYYSGQKIEDLIKIKEGDQIIYCVECEYVYKYDSLVIVTQMGYIKRHNISELMLFNKLGKFICNLSIGDVVVKIMPIAESNSVALFSINGKCVTLDYADVKEYHHRKTRGIRTMKFKDSDHIADAITLEKDSFVVIISNDGYAKKVAYEDLSRTRSRNTIGITCLTKSGTNFSDRKIINCLTAKQDSLFVIFTKLHNLLICNTDTLPILNRTCKGVKVVDLSKGDSIMSAHKI